MNALVVYYSLEGNTKWAAEQIGEKLGADVLALTPETAYPDKGFRKYFWGGKSSVMKEAPALKPYQAALKNYDGVIFASPVWAGSFAPPLRTFIRSEKLDGKKFALVACSGGGSPARAFANLKELLNAADEIPTLWLVEPKSKPRAEHGSEIAAFCRKLEEEGWN